VTDKNVISQIFEGKMVRFTVPGKNIHLEEHKAFLISKRLSFCFRYCHPI